VALEIRPGIRGLRLGYDVNGGETVENLELGAVLSIFLGWLSMDLTAFDTFLRSQP